MHGKTGLPSHLNSCHAFPCDNIRKTFIVMHNPVFEQLDTLSFALPACFIFLDKWYTNQVLRFHFCSVYYMLLLTIHVHVTSLF